MKDYKTARAAVAVDAPNSHLLRAALERVDWLESQYLAVCRVAAERGERLREATDRLRRIDAPHPQDGAQEAGRCQHGHKQKTSGCVSCELLYQHSPLASEGTTGGQA